MKLKNLRFRTRLIIGFSSGLLMSVIIMIIAIYEIHNISEHTKLIYQHPFLVSNNVKDINIYINAIHHTMKDIVLAKNKEQVDSAIIIINENDRKIHAAFDIVYKRFLGDINVVDDAHDTYVAWTPIRNEVIKLMRIKNIDMAVGVTKGKGASHVKLLFSKTKVLINFAENKANEYLINVKNIEKASIIILIIIFFLLFLIGLIVSITISNSISKPITGFIEKTKYLYENSLNINAKNTRKLSEQNILKGVSIKLIDSSKYMTKI